MEEDDEYESHWHLVDCTLNRALGYGIAPEELAERITTGTINLSGICEWLQTVLHWPGVTRDLLEGKMNRLKDALIIWYVDLLHVRPLHIHSIHHSGATTSDMGVGSTSRGAAPLQTRLSADLDDIVMHEDTCPTLMRSQVLSTVRRPPTMPHQGSRTTLSQF